MIKQHFEASAGYRKWTLGLLAVGGLILVLGFIFLGLSKDEHSQTRFWAVLLQNSTYFLLVVNASMFFICVTCLALGGWQMAFRRVPEAISTLVPVFSGIALVIFLYLIFGPNHHIYHWTDKGHIEHDSILKGKSGFLNPWFFLIWSIVAMGMWSWAGAKMRQLSSEADERPMENDEAKNFHRRNTVWAAIFTVAFGLTVGSTIPWFWLMSIDAHWYSTMYSWYTFASTFVSGMALIALFVVYLKNRDYLEWVNQEHLQDLGKFMFAFTIFWTYLWYSQFMLIWYANIPEETIYFKVRMHGPYRAIFFLNLILNFVLPFLLLMTRGSKRNYTVMTFLAILIVFGHWLDFYQMVMPGALGEHYSLGWFEFGILALYAGLIMHFVGKALAKKPLVSVNHPLLKESIIHHA
ncbi:quinol:cytochrome C oxidoreductase [Pollutibacter soli]|uniref:quinol:cytochrome C oxidoreductase n=1 Tax=Pollutibacter soli TaxID=3034157 RepID=UPI00301408CD